MINFPITLFSSSSTSFDPLSISGCVLWLDSSDTATLFKTDGTTQAVLNDELGKWGDKSGNARHATQNTATRYPYLRSDGIEFTAQWFDIASSLSALTAATVFIVVKIDSDPPGGGGASGLWALGNSPTTHFPYIDGTIYDDFGSSARKTTVNPATDLTGWNNYSVTTASGEWTSRLNGTQLYTTASNTVAWNGGHLLGKSGSAIFLDGKIREFLIYDSALNSTNRGLVETYLRSKWTLP